MPLLSTRGAASAKGFGLTASSGSVLLINGTPQLTNTYLYYTTSNPYTLTVSAGQLTFDLYLWGASGGANDYSGDVFSGAGGGALANLTLFSGTTYYLYIGQGGRPPTSTSGTGGVGGWPNGGDGTQGDASGAGGGGMTMFSRGVYSISLPVADIFLIAGAGGGCTGYNGSAGAGGGTDGQGALNFGGQIVGGSQTQGGQYNGDYLKGGNATRTSASDDGGGGGGGFYGGGGGTSDAKPAAGGSGYGSPSLTNSFTLYAGNSATAPTIGGVLLSGYASGKSSGTRQVGSDGLAYIKLT